MHDKARQNAVLQRGSTPGEGSARNGDVQPPRDIGALFARQLANSTRAAQADQRLQTRIAQAAAKLGRDQVRLLEAKARQLGVLDLFKDLAAARERHIGTAIQAIEESVGSAKGRVRASGRKSRTKKTRKR